MPITETYMTEDHRSPPSPIREGGNVAALYEALAVAQGEFEPVEKKREGKVQGESAAGKAYNYTYKYADLSDVLNAVRPALSRHGLGTVQVTQIVNSSMVVISRLTHKSGAWIESDYPVAGLGTDRGFAHQKVGAALSYARRYGLSALLGIAAEDEVDNPAEEAVDDAGGAPQPRAEPPRRPVPHTQIAHGVAAEQSQSRKETAKVEAKADDTFVGDEFVLKMRTTGTVSELVAWHKSALTKIREKDQKWQDGFYARYDDHMAALKAAGKGIGTTGA